MAQRKANRPRPTGKPGQPDARSQARLWRKFLRLTRGRIPVLKALEVMVAEEGDPILRSVLEQMLHGVENGSAISDALAHVVPAMSRSVIELVRSAEKTGAWDEILLEIAEGLEEGTFGGAM